MHGAVVTIWNPYTRASVRGLLASVDYEDWRRHLFCHPPPDLLRSVEAAGTLHIQHGSFSLHVYGAAFDVEGSLL